MSSKSGLLQVTAPPLVALVLGYGLKYLVDRKQASSTAGAEYKRRMYQGYVETILKFYHEEQPTDPKEIEERNKWFRESSQTFQKQYILDAAPGVIRAIARLNRYFEAHQNQIVDERKAGRMVTKIFKAMRRDIGTSNFVLGPSAGVILAPVLMYNYDKIMHPRWWKIKSRFRKYT